MRLSSFFALNYLTYALVFSAQVVISRQYGLEIFGQYAVYVALMGLLEAPLMIARADSALSFLNENRTNRKLGLDFVKADLKSSVLLSPLIFLIVLTNFNAFVALAAVATVFVQSGYAGAKSFFIVHDLKRQLSIIEVITALFGVALIFFGGVLNINFYTLVVYYFIFSLAKNIILLCYLRINLLLSITSVDEEALFSYQPTPKTLIFRSIVLNFITNIDLLLLAGMLDLHQIGMYKIVKSSAAVLFRVVGPLWRWKLYTVNIDANENNMKDYSKSQLQGGAVLFVFLLVLLPIADHVVNFFAVYIFANAVDLDFIPAEMIFANSFLLLWFLAWYKIDMLYRVNKFGTLVWPLFYCVGVGLISVLFISTFSEWIAYYFYWNCFYVFIACFYLLIWRGKDGFINVASKK